MSAVRLRPGLLAQLRRSTGLSQAEVAARVEGLQREQNLGDWERARAQPHPRFIPPLAAVLGVEPLSLLDVDPEDPPLEALRLAVGLSQLELEVRSGVHRTTYARLEKGTRRGEPEPATTRCSRLLWASPLSGSFELRGGAATSERELHQAPPDAALSVCVLSEFMCRLSRIRFESEAGRR